MFKIEIMTNIEKSIKLKNELNSLRPLKKEDELRIMQKFRLDWNYHSNNLEGNTLTYGETKALILFGITAQGKPLKDHFEVTGHDEAIKWVMSITTQERPITENFIRELHKLILKESYEVDAITPEGLPTKKKVNVGVYKTEPNHVKTKTGEIFRFATPEETPAMMNELVTWFRNKTEERDINPILLASEFHYKYIRIHPFDDGNGRTARILMNFILMQFGFPPVIIKTDDKENYFAALRQADAGLIEPFIEYIAQNLNRSLEIMISGAKGKSIDEPDDLEKEIALLDQKLKSVAQPIEVVKNKESILNIYNNSVSNLAEKFIEKGELFGKFYIKHLFRLYINKKLINRTKESVIRGGRTFLQAHTNTVTLEYSYQAFNKIGFDEFNNASRIQFHFNFSTYKVTAKGNISYEKPYNEQLTEEEILEMVNDEIRIHKEAIESKIEEIKKKKK